MSICYPNSDSNSALTTCFANSITVGFQVVVPRGSNPPPVNAAAGTNAYSFYLYDASGTLLATFNDFNDWCLNGPSAPDPQTVVGTDGNHHYRQLHAVGIFRHHFRPGIFHRVRFWRGVWWRGVELPAVHVAHAHFHRARAHYGMLHDAGSGKPVGPSRAADAAILFGANVLGGAVRQHG